MSRHGNDVADPTDPIPSSGIESWFRGRVTHLWAVHPYLSLGYVPAPASLFKGIAKLPPATMLAIERGRIEETRYWRIPHHVERGVSESEWIERIRAGWNSPCACKW